jgi:predicted lipid-binding transport protein (Tim44 family)
MRSVNARVAIRMSEAFDIYTLLFLVLAVVIFIRLRGVLGRRTGNERPPYDPYTRAETKPGAPEGTVVALPRGRTGQPPAGESAGPSQEDIEERLERFAAKDSPLGQSLTALIKADPSFDPAEFLDGAKAAYEMVVTAFAEGDEATLKQLLGADVLDGFMGAIEEREQRGETIHSTLVGIDKADIIEAEVKDKQAYITVKFVSELISVTRDSDGEVIEGDSKKVREVTDIWTFCRDITSRNPNWKLVATEAAN